MKRSTIIKAALLVIVPFIAFSYMDAHSMLPYLVGVLRDNPYSLEETWIGPRGWELNCTPCRGGSNGKA